MSEPRSGEFKNFRQANSMEQREEGKAGLPFFLLTFSLATQRKSKLPSGEIPI